MKSRQQLISPLRFLSMNQSADKLYSKGDILYGAVLLSLILTNAILCNHIVRLDDKVAALTVALEALEASSCSMHGMNNNDPRDADILRLQYEQTQFYIIVTCVAIACAGTLYLIGPGIASLKQAFTVKYWLSAPIYTWLQHHIPYCNDVKTYFTTDASNHIMWQVKVINGTSVELYAKFFSSLDYMPVKDFTASLLLPRVLDVSCSATNALTSPTVSLLSKATLDCLEYL
jgi:hypothetical protein